MIAFIREMRSKLSSITISNCPGRLSVFAVQRCRELWNLRHARMIKASELRQPEAVAVITECGSYLIQPRFFDESLWDYSRTPQGALFMDDIPASAMMRSVASAALDFIASRCS
jgi:hypothetical protein